MASSDVDASYKAAPVVLVCPSVKVRYSTCVTAAIRSGSCSTGGTANVAPIWRSLLFARLIR